MDIKLYKCAHCGNIAIKVVDSGVPLVCCGEPMEELVAGAVDGAFEKHVPAVAIDGSTVKVQVGEVEHPMVDAQGVRTNSWTVRSGQESVCTAKTQRTKPSAC